MRNDQLFMKIIPLILEKEGGYVNHPNDPGGETKYGITKRQYPDLDIKALTEEKAMTIYYEKYWKVMKANLDKLDNPELVLQLFDMGINAGPQTAIMLLQALVNVKMDGIIGVQTIEAVKRLVNPVISYKMIRKYYYKFLVIREKKNMVFLEGWINRVDKIKLK